MNFREKIFILLGALFIGLSGFYYLFMEPSWEKVDRLQKMIRHREKENAEIERLQKKYVNHTEKLKSLENRIGSIEKGFSTLTFLETVAQNSNVRKNITSITPQAPVEAGRFKGTALEIKMEDIRLSKIVEYLYRIENSEYLIKVNRVNLKNRYDAKDSFDARFSVISFTTT